MTWRDKLGIGYPDRGEIPETPVEPEFKEAGFRAHEVEKLAKNDANFLAALFMPAVFKYLFPAIFIQIWNWLVHHAHKVRDFSQLAIGLPRGFGKTMLIKVFVGYCILFTNKKFILIICGTQTKANNILTDIFSMLSESNVLRVFGNWKIGVETDRQDLKRFGFRGRTIIVMGAGAQSDIRGITLENERPDVIIFDDIQTREEADSEQVSSNLETWMYGTAMKAKSPHGCLFIFIANMYPTKNSLLRKIKSNPAWTKVIVGGILSDGTSLWEDLQPINQLLKEFENDLHAGKPEIFFSEVLNDENASVNNLVDLSKLPKLAFAPGDIHQGNFIVIDPSGNKSTSDAVSVMYFEIYDSVPICRKLKEGRMSPGDTIRTALIMALEHNCCVIAIESNAYQASLCYWFNFITTQQGIQGIHPVEIYSGANSKNSRILTMFKQLKAGEIGIDSECLAAVSLQVVSFNPLKTNNTDGLLDCLAYAPKVMELYMDLIISSLTIENQEFSKIRIPEAIENSPF
jgi:hypothetical protein